MSEHDLRLAVKAALDDGASEGEIRKWVDSALDDAFERAADDLADALKYARREGLIE